jgi:hypothetical protein
MLASCTLLQPGDAQTIEIEVILDDSRCGLMMAGDEFSEVAALVSAVRESGAKRVRLVADRKVPYRCVGGLVFELQRAGFDVTFGAQG